MYRVLIFLVRSHANGVSRDATKFINPGWGGARGSARAAWPRPRRNACFTRGYQTFDIAPLAEFALLAVTSCRCVFFWTEIPWVGALTADRRAEKV